MKRTLLVLSWLCAFGLIDGMEKTRDGVCAYEGQHKPDLLRMALPDIARLVTTFKHTEEAYKELLDGQIEGSLDSLLVHTRVYMHESRPAGFITYSLNHPWHRAFVPAETGPNAEVHHLVVDRSHRGKGLGTALMGHVIAESRERSVNRISLWANDPDLCAYYMRLGFSHVRTSSANKLEQQYAMRLKPHPALVVTQMGLRALKLLLRK